MKYHGGRLSLKLQATLRTAFLLLGGGVREANTESLYPISCRYSSTHACLTKLQLFSKLCLVTHQRYSFIKDTSIFYGEIPRATAKNSP